MTNLLKEQIQVLLTPHAMGACLGERTNNGQFHLRPAEGGTGHALAKVYRPGILLKSRLLLSVSPCSAYRGRVLD